MATLAFSMVQMATDSALHGTIMFCNVRKLVGALLIDHRTPVCDTDLFIKDVGKTGPSCWCTSI